MPHGLPGSHVPPIDFDEINKYERESYGSVYDAYGHGEMFPEVHDDPNSIGTGALFPETNNMSTPIIFVSAFFLWRFLK